jgi:hypothetical protein
VALKRRDKARSFKDSSETTPVTFHSDETGLLYDDTILGHP